MIEHLGDEAELYPLGLLDETEARNIERHIEHCPQCAERVMNARMVAASLAARLPEVRPPAATARPSSFHRSAFLGWAVAAMLALAVLALGWQTLTMRGRLAAQDVALVTLVHSHFNHVSTAPQSASPVAAKILYARDGSWIYIIADKPGAGVRALARTPSGLRDLGPLTGSARTATLLVRPRDRIRSVVLQRNGTTVASAILVY